MNEADRRREFEIGVLARLETLEQKNDSGAIARNAQALKETLEWWNEEFLKIDARLNAHDNNTANWTQIVKDIQHNNTLALARLRGNGPTS